MLRDLKGLSILDGGVPTLSEAVHLPADATPKHSNAGSDRGQTKSPSMDELRIEPFLGAAAVPSQPAPTWKKSGNGGGFSRDAYLKEVRESLFGSVLISLVVLMLVLGALFVFGKEVLVPQMNELKQKQANVVDLPLALKTVDAQLDLQQKKLQSIGEQNNRLMNYFPDSQDIETTYVDFLNMLESQKVSVVGQSGSVTQNAVNPLWLSFKASGDEKKQIASHAGKTKAVNLSGAVTNGLNYYHVEIALQGSYVGYLSARQALVNANPNLIVHAETIHASTTTPGQMDMVVFASLPFLSQP